MITQLADLNKDEKDIIKLWRDTRISKIKIWYGLPPIFLKGVNLTLK
jgi:hypothetical protein